MKHGSLFSGIGGFDLAAEWAEWTNVFHCEIEEFPKKILKYYWPKAISYGDITKTDFTIHRGQIDVLTGGFPCQPFSLAGKRKGTEDHRNLWPEMLRAIQEIQPIWIVGENVPGLINWSGGLVFEQVQIDLENEGYEVTPYILPACSKDAPHKRERVWFVAYSESIRNRRCSSKERGIKQWKFQQDKQTGGKMGCEVKGCDSERIIADTGSQQFQERPQNNISQDREKNGTGMDNRIERQGDLRASANTNKLNGDISGLRASKISQQQTSGLRKNNVTNTINQGHERSQRRETHEQRDWKETLRSASQRFEIPTWDNWPTQSPVCSGDDGFPGELDGITFPKWRNESIKAYGNAIVPQVVLQIFKVINEMEKHSTFDVVETKK